MRVLLSTYESGGDVEPMVGRTVQLRALGAEVWVCVPPDGEFAQPPAGVWQSPAGTIPHRRGATVPATPLVDAVSRERLMA